MTTSSPRQIVCAVDFSAGSRTALRYAAAAAEILEARLTVLTVNDPLLVEAMRAYASRDWPAPEREELRAFCVETIGVERDLEVEVRIGRPATEIRALADRLKADLLVMGCHGLTGVRKLFFGSTTERVLRDSVVPVLVTPTNLHAPSSASDLRSLVRRILVPVDLSEASGALARIGVAIGRGVGVPVLLVHAVEPVHVPPRWHGRAPSIEFEARDRAEAALRRVVDDAGGGLEPIVLFGEAAESIINVAEIRAAGLIVMGLQQSGLGRVGVVAYRVLSRTHVPVLALPAAAAARIAETLALPVQATPDART